MLNDVAYSRIIASVNPAIIAILVLALVAAALVYTALYAVFGKPPSSHGKKRKQEVISGFQLAGGLLLGFVLMGCLVAFAGIAVGVTPSSLQISRPIAGIIAISAFCIISLTVQRWAKYFAGWIAWAIYASLLMASSGHLLNNPEIPVKRSVSLTMGALCFVTVLVTRRFTKAYKLHLVEKIASMAWIGGFVLGAIVEKFSIPALATGTFALVFAWWRQRS